MTLRPPILQRAAATLLRRAPPRLMGSVLAAPSSARFNSSEPPPPFTPRAPRDRPQPVFGGLSSFLDTSVLSRSVAPPPTPADDALSMEFPVYTGTGTAFGVPGMGPEDNMFRLCVLATKHNTHITFTKPNKDVLLTLSCGNVGFKKANRGTFDAAYQLSSVFFQRMDKRGPLPKNLEINFRDFGPGREAFIKVLLGREGKNIRGLVRRVTDNSRLKFGGTRSRAVRRL
ncbi:hypothetical protein Q9L58_007859 [Maublancomyces gigas]|uniref:Ribosomal protein S11 n=1 Tax=Discina gigas TaxID=1032678 RepID=A0ABR3GBB6_9PEZI